MPSEANGSPDWPPPSLQGSAAVPSKHCILRTHHCGLRRSQDALGPRSHFWVSRAPDLCHVDTLAVPATCPHSAGCIRTALTQQWLLVVNLRPLACPHLCSHFCQITAPPPWYPGVKSSPPTYNSDYPSMSSEGFSGTPPHPRPTLASSKVPRVTNSDADRAFPSSAPLFSIAVSPF